MNVEPDPKLAAQVDQALKRLPDLKAPSSLLRHVLSAIEAQSALPWWRRSWWNWPMSAKAAFAVVTTVLAALLSGGGYVLSEGATVYSKQWTDRLPAADLQAPSFDSLWNAVHLLAQSFQPLFHYAAFAGVLLYLVCIGLGTACFRFAVKHA
jgi:hypothetical protein